MKEKSSRKFTPHQKATIAFYLDILAAKHPLVKNHCQKVATNAARVAKRLNRDIKAAYMAGVFHDIGKVVINHSLFEDRNITEAEYKEIQEHSLLGYNILKKEFPFTSLCCGLHHAMSTQQGYGLKVEDLPNRSPATIKKILEVSTIVAICDFIDAATSRKTSLFNQKEPQPLRDMLLSRFPDEQLLINTALLVFNQNDQYGT
jgi:putative nucleotidyltransferase with HDIG domain